MAYFNNSMWVQDATMVLTAKGYEPNLVVRELSAYISGHAVQATEIIKEAIAWMGMPPESYAVRHNYEAARDKWVETGDLDWLRAMIDSVTLDG